MRAKEVALAIRVWAEENKLFKTDFPVELQVTLEEKDQVFEALGISYRAESIFRHRGISAVAFNQAANEVIVFTEKSVPVKEQKLLPHDISEEVTVRYIHAGTAHAGVPPTSAVASPYVMRGDAFACGGSIHPAKIVGAGTLGCLVRDNAGVLFGLTNNHVSGMSNYASIGEKILAPGHLDIAPGGINPFTIGYHERALPMVQGKPDNVNIATNSDAALIRIASEHLVSSYQGNLFDTPTGTFELLAGQTVEKVGRTTGYTKGEVLGEVIGPHPIGYNTPGYGGHLSFFEPIFAIRGFNGEHFSQSGDSGSLITIQAGDVRFAVGLVFAGNATTGISYALSLQPILANLGVTLVSGHNT